MKSISTIILLAAAMTASAAEEVVAPTDSEFKAGEFQAEIFGAVATKDLDTERTGYGFGVSYYITESLGAGLRTTLDELSGHTFESVSPRLLWRVPLGGKHALYAFAQGTRVFHDRTVWTVEAGPGYCFRPFGSGLELFAEIGMRKEIAGADRSTDTFGTGEVGLRFTW